MSDIHPLKRNRFDHILETLGLTGLVASFVPLFFFDILDKDTQIPIHYDLYGNADGWGNLSILWITPLLAAGFYLLFLVLERLYPKFHYPIRITAANAPYVYRAGVRLMRSLKALFSILLAYINNTALAYALGCPCSFNRYFVHLFAWLFLATGIIYFIKTLQYKE